MLFASSERRNSAFKDYQPSFMFTPWLLFDAKATQSPFRGSIERFFYLKSKQKEHFQSLFTSKIESTGISSFSASVPIFQEFLPNIEATPKSNPQWVSFLHESLGNFSSDCETEEPLMSQSYSQIDLRRNVSGPSQLVFARPSLIDKLSTEIPRICMHKMVEDELKARAKSILKRGNEYACKYCGDVFRTGCGLGGHISKVHQLLKKKAITKSKGKCRPAGTEPASPDSNHSLSLEPFS